MIVPEKYNLEAYRWIEDSAPWLAKVSTSSLQRLKLPLEGNIGSQLCKQ